MLRKMTFGKESTISTVVKSSWQLLKENSWLWILILVLVHCLSWKFANETWESLAKYMKWAFEFDIKEVFEKNASIYNYSYIEILVVEIICSITNLTLLQVVFSPIICQSLQKRNPKISLDHSIDRLKSVEFIRDILRMIGVIIFLIVSLIFYVTIMNQFLGILTDHEWKTWIKWCIASVSIISLFFYLTRWVFAVPVAVVENKHFLESLKKSWEMTRFSHLGIRAFAFPITIVLTLSITIICAIIHGYFLHAPNISVRLPMVFSMLMPLIVSIITPVSYYHFRD